MMTQRKISLIVLSLVFLFIGTYKADACTCSGRVQNSKGYQPCWTYWISDAVFIGLAEKISIENGRMKVSFSVEKSVRGVNEKTIEIFTSANTGTCGYPFKQGERYFVYSRRGQDGKLREGLCGPTVLLKNAEEDLEYVKEIESGKRGSRLYGSVHRIEKESYTARGSFVPLAGIEVTIKGKKNKFKTQTDADGRYVFKEIPADIYRVTAKLPEGLREIVTREDLINHYAVIYDKNAPPCDSESFIATSQGSIRGKIINTDGTNPPQQFVSLVPIDENGKTAQFVSFQEVWANRQNGEYFFNAVPAGKYLLVINPKNCPHPTNGYGTMFFPGVANVTDSKIIPVTNYQQITVEDFRLLPPLKERWISGVVLSADKTPVAAALVSLIDADRGQCGNFHSEMTTDESGRFRLKGYESYRYQIRAYTGVKNQGRQIPRFYSKLFVIPLNGGNENIELIVDSTY